MTQSKELSGTSTVLAPGSASLISTRANSPDAGGAAGARARRRVLQKYSRCTLSPLCSAYALRLIPSACARSKCPNQYAAARL